MIIRLAERELATRFGVFNELLYYDGQRESIALTSGRIENGSDVICRLHSACVGGHVFNSIECECAAEMAAAQREIQAAGCGVIVYLDQEGRGNGHLALLASIPFKKAGMSQAEAYKRAGFAADARSYRPAAAILHELNVASIVLLTSNPEKACELREAGITVAGTREMKLDLESTEK